MKELNDILIEEFLDKEYAHSYVDEFLNLKIATAIKVLREQREWTQEQLADESGMKQSRVSLLENVNYSSWSLSTLKKLAWAFDLTLDVDFKEFSERIFDISNLNKETLERASRLEDLEKLLNTDVVENASALEYGLQPFLDDQRKVHDYEYHRKRKKPESAKEEAMGNGDKVVIKRARPMGEAEKRTIANISNWQESA